MIILVKQYLYSLADQTNLNISGLFDGLHLGLNSLQQYLSDLNLTERLTNVDIYNRKHNLIKPFNLYQPNFSMQNSTDSGIGFIIFIMIILTDQKYFPLFFKMWLIGVLYFIYLVWIDWMRIPIVYKIPSRLSNNRENEGFDLFSQQSVRFEDESPISINQCTFQIHTVKIVDIGEVSSVIGGSNLSGIVDSDALSSPNTVLNGEIALFQLVISHPTKRWSVWRRYEDFHEVYCALHEKYFPSHHSIRYTKLHSLRRLKKLHRSFSSAAGGGGSNASSFYGAGVMDSTVAVDVSDDSAEFLEMPFLLKLQYEMLSWLKVVQTDLVLGDDDVVSALLRLPSFEKAQASQTSRVNSSTAHRDLLRHNFRQAAMRPSKVAAGRVGVDDSYFQVAVAQKNATIDLANDSTESTALGTAVVLQQSSPHQQFYMNDEEPDVISADGTWKGTDMHNFQWLNHTPEIRAMYTDCSYNHNFKVRGLNYMTDKKKVDAGPAISRFICMDLYRVDVPKYGDRHDHVCSIGRAKRRLEVLTGLPDKPFIFVLNIQLPGDPPVSCVFYFAIPASLDRDDEMRKMRTMFSQYIDFPFSEGGAADKTEPSLSSAFDSAAAQKQCDARDDVFADTIEQSAPVSNLKGPAKSWTSDIVWPSVGADNPGVLDKRGFQNMRFKLIPNMVEAPWVVQMAVASTPCILGQKVVQRYFRGARYVETDVHVGSSTIANNIVALCRAYSKVFICNIGVVLQGESADELPERMLACATLVHVDTELAGSIEDYSEKQN